MPYVDKTSRKLMQPIIEEFEHNMIDLNKGDLNYLFSRMVSIWVAQHGMNYQTMSDALAALQDCRDEFYRRVVAPYEDIKKVDNGDVYDELF